MLGFNYQTFNCDIKKNLIRPENRNQKNFRVKFMFRYLPDKVVVNVSECMSKAPAWQTIAFTVVFFLTLLFLIVGVFSKGKGDPSSRFLMTFLAFLLLDCIILLIIVNSC